MKTKTKALLMALCAVMLVAASIFGTLAFLTDTDSVKNTFTVGKVDITLDEAEVDENGDPIEGADRVKENEYHLLPGHTYTKDPTVHVSIDSEEAYLFVKLEIANNDGLVAAYKNHGIDPTLDNILTGYDSTKWTVIEAETDENGKKTYIAYYNDTVTKNQDVKLFDSIKVPEVFTNTDMALIGDFDMNINAYAVQKDGFTTQKGAWDATFGAPVANP